MFFISVKKIRKNKQECKMMNLTPKNVSYEIYLIYTHLYELQEKKQNFLTRQEIYFELQTVAVLDNESITLENELKKLEKKNVIMDVGEDRFYILNPENNK
jgi:hypothetical protein